jgi:NADH dehydrogenase
MDPSVPLRSVRLPNSIDVVAHRVVIVGCGFAGLHAARGLGQRDDVTVTVVDRTNHHLFQPLLYQVATGGLSPADIASPIRYVLRKQANTTVVLDEVTGIDPGGREVTTAGGRYPYDSLIVATGVANDYFGNAAWETHAPGLKTLADATTIRADILSEFERAERSGSGRPTFVVVGGGPTGVEMAGTIAEMAHHTLRRDFRHIDPASARVLLVEAGPRVLPTYPSDLSAKAQDQLTELGVDVHTGWRVTAIAANAVTLRTPAATDEVVPTAAVVWAAGVAASPLGGILHRAAGAELDASGRVKVQADLTIAGHPEIMVLGDLAHVEHDGEVVPGVAPAAIQMGRYAARRIVGRLDGRSVAAFRYRDKGTLATIGRSAAVADFGRIRFGGWPAWVAWLAIHLYFLIGFENRLLVMVQWGWNYLTRTRSARLIVDYRSRGD